MDCPGKFLEFWGTNNGNPVYESSQHHNFICWLLLHLVVLRRESIVDFVLHLQSVQIDMILM